MAKMQMELERQKKKKSPIADIVSVLIKCMDARISRCIILTIWLPQDESIGPKSSFYPPLFLWIKTAHNKNKCVIFYYYFVNYVALFISTV